ncbi:biopolymer transport protein ExbB [Constrictibacter sp. MBR-5]|jgi:biopolymer transport protein ExbB|uniref:MotA/TolQ/ExbB proton channel family protein n=1 Tax=Constrictibacter sp. MBR-5 TaxID=3156467 RepID=UPI00339A05D2
MLLDMAQVSGPAGMVLGLFSVAGLAIVLLKLWQFASVRIGQRSFVDPALRHFRMGRRDAALAELAKSRNPIARVLEVAIGGSGRADPELLREEAWRVGNEHLEGLRSHLRGLEVIASLSPLLGLFGTVLGMISAFQQLETAGSRVDPSILSGGIWEALLTTAIGLAVAIPAVVALHWLERMIERLGSDMENAVTRVFTAPIVVGEAEHGRQYGVLQAQPAE